MITLITICCLIYIAKNIDSDKLFDMLKFLGIFIVGIFIGLFNKAFGLLALLLTCLGLCFYFGTEHNIFLCLLFSILSIILTCYMDKKYKELD